jgi:cyanate lyase
VTRDQLTEKILDIKRQRGLTWGEIYAFALPLSPVLTVGALLGQMRLAPRAAAEVGQFLGLNAEEIKMLGEIPNRGTPMPPSDPLLYRFYELLMVNGPAWKALIEEEFGDGIMSAIDFNLDLGREIDPKGDRVRITMSGKFLAFKYYECDRDAAFAVSNE